MHSILCPVILCFEDTSNRYTEYPCFPSFFNRKHWNRNHLLNCERKWYILTFDLISFWAYISWNDSPYPFTTLLAPINSKAKAIMSSDVCVYSDFLIGLKVLELSVSGSIHFLWWSLSSLIFQSRSFPTFWGFLLISISLLRSPHPLPCEMVQDLVCSVLKFSLLCFSAPLLSFLWACYWITMRPELTEVVG